MSVFVVISTEVSDSERSGEIYFAYKAEALSELDVRHALGYADRPLTQ